MYSPVATAIPKPAVKFSGIVLFPLQHISSKTWQGDKESEVKNLRKTKKVFFSRE